MSKTKKKLALPTFEVTYWDNSGEEKETILVRPVPLDKLEEVKTLQEKLIFNYVEHDGCLGSLFQDKAIASTMTDLASMLPVIGKKETGFDLSNLFDSGDIIQLGQIFFSESITPDMRSQGIKPDKVTERLIYHFPEHRYNPTPSAIARIHDLPFFDKFQKVRDEKIEALQEQMLQESKARETDTAT